MPRKYKKKVNSGYANFTEESMNNAVADVRAGLLSIKKAAFKYGVKRPTLMNCLKHVHCGSVGRPTILTRDEEAVIVHAVQKLGDWGFGIDRDVVARVVQDFINSDNRDTPFRNGKPGRDWMYGFEHRWKNELTRRVAQPLPASRAYACNENVVNDFFEKLQSAVSRLQLKHKPQNSFNVDETGFMTDIGNQKILCRRGFRNPHKTVATSTKTMYTVQVCCSAVGSFLSPYVVYKGCHLYSTWTKGGPDNAKYTCSKSGWMESAHFIEWFVKVFIAETAELDGAKLLVFDGHNSHVSKTVVELAIANNIELLCLPAHTSNILQPLDVGVFKTVKAKWRTCLKTYYDETRYKNVDKAAFPCLLKRLIGSGAFSNANAITAFQACGIYPVDRSKITADKLATSEPLVTGNVISLPSSSEDLAESTGSVSVSEGEAGLPVTTRSHSPATPTILPSPSENSVGVTVTPRKRIETALLAHLRHVTPTDTGEKRKRIKRTLAECLTSAECHARLVQMETEKISKVKTAKASKATALTKGKQPAVRSKKRLGSVPLSQSLASTSAKQSTTIFLNRYDSTIVL